MPKPTPRATSRAKLAVLGGGAAPAATAATLVPIGGADAVRGAKILLRTAEGSAALAAPGFSYTAAAGPQLALAGASGQLAVSVTMAGVHGDVLMFFGYEAQWRRLMAALQMLLLTPSVPSAEL